MENQRPDPDSLLDLIKQDTEITGRGKLKIFFGASAGAGKTYAMLSEAWRRMHQGVDVVIGIVETHGRKETLQRTEGFSVIPTREIAHRGVTLQEFDLEAALARKPGLILVDEYAHTNAPGSRHPKRWQDVEELLSRGIDVFTTLNVQHLESINDMVTKLTGIVVRETVPDSVFDSADEISLIDVSSDELLKRLAEGKVYIAEGANKRAAENFFKETNLVALRELALRRTAERVDAQMDLLTASQGQNEAQIGLKILACVGPDSLSADVIRHVKRISTRARAPWYVVYVETERHDSLTDKAKLAVDRNLRMAERMGAEIVRLTGSNAVDEIINYARTHGFSRIAVGHRQRSRGLGMFRGSLSQKLVAKGAGLEITTITEKIPEERLYNSLKGQFLAKPSSYVSAFLILLTCTLVALPLRAITDPDNLIMIYLVGVMIVAARLGTGPSIVASLTSVLIFDFFFTLPYNSFHLSSPHHYFTFIMMLVTSFIVGSLAAKLSWQAQQSRKREQETSTLYALTKELSVVRDMHEMSETAVKHIREAFAMEAVVLVLENNRLEVIPEHTLIGDVKEESVARWVLQNGLIAGRNTDTLPSAKGLYVPLLAEKEALGVLGLIPQTEGYDFTTEEISHLETFASLIASSFQRAYRARDAEKATVESESEKLRNVLLSSVSYDLRAPLSSIIASASTSLLSREKLPQKIVQSLQTIHEQAKRLAKLVTNLLDASSLESGNVKLNKHACSIQEVITSSLEHIQSNKVGRSIAESVPDYLPPVDIDALLIEQVLVNLLDNAIRFTPSDGIITITVEDEKDWLRLHVKDNGEGITKGNEEKIFEKFYSQGHRTEGNAGLGLAICRGIITAHGGIIYARNNKEGGACFSFTLPKEQAFV